MGLPGQIVGAYLSMHIRGGTLEKNSTEPKTKDTTWSLGPPKPISKEYLFPGWNTKSLADFENFHTLSVFETKK